jgi:hypothetical protein
MSKILSIIFLFTAFAAFGQQSKTRQVDEALGTRIREIPAQGDAVEYCFQIGRKDVSFYRTGDGASQYTELLQKTSGMGDYNDQGGTLLFVKKNGEVVARGNAAGSIAEQPTANRVRYVDQTGDPMRTTAVTREPDGFAMPDSMQVAERLDGLKRDITGWKGKMWQTIAPAWDFCMWLFSSIAVLLVSLIFFFRYIAASAANESLVGIYGNVIAGRWMVSVQQNAAVLTLACVWLIAAVLWVKVVLWMVWADLSLWLMVPCAAVLAWFAEKVTDWLVPNLRVASGGRGHGGAISPY